MNTKLFYVFDVLSGNVPYCVKCGAFHHEGYRCITSEEKEAVRHQVVETANKITPQSIIDSAFGN